MKTHLSLILLLLTICCYGQSEKMFTVDRELSNSTINQIYQSRDGVIWIATDDGLNRYDGAKFSVYKHEEGNESSLIDNNVRVIFEDSQGHFLIGTQRGLQLYDPATDRFKEIPFLYDSGTNMQAHISKIIERKNGVLLVATSGHGIYSLQLTGEESVIKELQLVPSYFITCIFEDKAGNLWISTEGKGFYRIDTSEKTHEYFTGKENAWNIITGICQDEKDNIYVSSISKGIFVYNRDKDSFDAIACSANHCLPVNTLYATGKGKIYLGTVGYGIKVYDTAEKKIKESEFSFGTFDFSKADVRAIMKDRVGNLWLGVNAKGVMMLPVTTNQFKYMGYKSLTTNMIGSNSIKAICKDREGNLWLGTANDGVYGLSNKSTIHFVRKNDTNSVPSTINCIHQTADGRLWLASPLEGLAEMNPKTGLCRYYKLQDRNQNDIRNISYLASDKEGENLWIAAMGSGLFYMNLKTGQINRCNSFNSGIEFQLEYNALHNGWIASLLYTTDDKLYIGTYDGLGCLDTKTMSFTSTFGKNRIFAGSIVQTLYEDERGDIWAGTAKGLIHLNGQGENSKIYTTYDGLPNNTICAIQGDREHGLWISTNYGISNLTPKTGSFVNYYAGNGLQGNEFNKNAAFTDENGYIIFGGINGITYFRPAEIRTEVKKPEVRIADFYIHNQAVKKGTKSGNHPVIDVAVQDAKEFHLSHKDNSFSIEFTAMEFYNPERITYLYSMNGATWTALAPGVNRVSFSDLTPGTHHFRMKAKDYTVYSEMKEITIRIDPEWWASGWAKSAYTLMALLMVGFIVMQVRHRYRMRQEMMQHIHAEQINEAKLQFFINISHEIRTPMSLIISPLQQLMAKDKDPECRKLYATIQRNAERILQLVNQLMDIRKIDKGQMWLIFKKSEVVGLVRELADTFGQQAKAKKLEFKFHSSLPEIEVWLDTKHFDKIILNLLSNACKFTPENGLVDISLSIGEDADLPEDAPLRRYVQLTVADSGIGIAPAEREQIFERFYQIRNSTNNSNVGTGIGLHLTRSLVELHYGSIHVEDNGEGQPGSRFIVRLPLGNKHLKKDELEEETAPTGLPAETPEAKNTVTSQPLPYAEEEEADGKARARSRRHVLVIEDDEEIRRYICRELGNDFYMTQCSNGKEGLAEILQRTPDLVISDVMMPEMDGLTLCRKIRQNVNINHLPIILLTARTREEDNLEGLETGADAYIMKPFSIELLRKTVLSLIRNREQLRNTFSGRQNREEQVVAPDVKSPNDRLMERVMRVISDNLGNPALTVEMISLEVGISRVHLHRKLKELTNQTTQQLIRNVRLKHAASLLAGKRHSITEVATMTGFASPTYFTTAFREMFGATPSEYMEQHAGGDAIKDSIL